VSDRSILSQTPSLCLPLHHIHVSQYTLSRMRAYHVRIVLHHSKSEQTDTFTPLSLWQPLPTHPYRSTARRNATFNPRGKDYRFGPIALDWVDFDSMASSLFVSKGKADPKGAFMTLCISAKAKAKLVCRTINCYFCSSKPH
jgi:hypothetical protein